MNGIDRIRAAFGLASAQDRAALITYIVCGRPSVNECVEIAHGLEQSGVDIIELGMPFSDPLADGPVIRSATKSALDDGIGTESCVKLVAAIREAGVQIPIVMMGYVNPLLAYGLDRFVCDIADAGADGLIVPDAGSYDRLRKGAQSEGLAFVQLVTPCTKGERLNTIIGQSSGFLYAVTSAGTTGMRDSVTSSTVDMLTTINGAVSEERFVIPVATGFGVRSAVQLAKLAANADGVIVGSALVEKIEQNVDSVWPFVASLVKATRRNQFDATKKTV